MKAIICGAGIAGLTLARRLNTLGWHVVLLERAPGPRTQGYMMDFFGPGYDAAEAMGLLPRLHELGYQVSEACLVDRNGRTRARLDFERFSRAVNSRMVNIPRPDLELALRESLPTEVDLRFSVGPVHVDNRSDGVSVTLSDGRVLHADLLVGADGVHSTVRTLVFGDERNHLRYLGFHTAAFTFHSPEIRARLEDRYCLTDTVDRQIGLYGLRDDRVAVFAVHRTGDPTLPTDRHAALLDDYGSLEWLVPEALAHCPPSEDVYYDQVAQIETSRWHRGRVVLVGDACHAVSLLAGQGASLGLAGAYVLADRLRRAASIEDGLGDYERVWRPVVEEKQRTARGGVRWFLPHTTAQLTLRRIVLGLSRLPGMHRLVARSQIGKPVTTITELGQQGDTTTGHSARR
ncbi:2-polyprenyl-6-methoxyphenol hydroxylase-like FAD-dependent oxidoreductase [Actinopolyspora lacussalsi]|nr:2-polyprenyl-6-methoxyphenol hydroxylase-like FAD-dependent oxidoreductase [Actinopolyspora lacussalsi]